VEPPRRQVAIFHPCLTEASFKPKKPVLEDATMEFICGAVADAPARRLESAVAVMMNFVTVIW
jgi:hypothetical protein